MENDLINQLHNGCFDNLNRVGNVVDCWCILLLPI